MRSTRFLYCWTTFYRLLIGNEISVPLSAWRNENPRIGHDQDQNEDPRIDNDQSAQRDGLPRSPQGRAGRWRRLGRDNSTHVDDFHYFDDWSNENPRFIRTRESRSDGNPRFIKNQEVEDRSAQRERVTTTYTIFIVYSRSALRDGIEGGKFRRNL